ncbi:MAG: glycosyltransferase family 39 protein [bacterium]|nr:glycosyltransferase family 39 protein [bacterium]
METQAIVSKKSLLIVLAVVVVAAIVHGQNLFLFPFIQDVEGTNLSNAWALMNTGELSPYTYVYEEPPAGSIILAAWASLTGGFSAFGFSMNSGRLFMLFCHLFSIVFVYGITQKVTKSDIAALVAALVFTFSPLSAGYQRRVLLENLMLPFLLASIYGIVGERRTLTHYIGSAFLFGLAVLTKLAVIGFLPAMLLFIRVRSDQQHRRFAVNLWLALALFLIALFPIYAQMKQELFPQGTFLGGDFPHVSLLESLGDRGPATGSFLNIGAGFGAAFALWTEISNTTADPVLVYGGLISALFTFVMGLDKRNAGLRATTFMMLGYALYLAAVGTIYSADIIPLLPILAINIGVLAGAVITLIAGQTPNLLRYGFATVAAGVILYPFITFYASRPAIYAANQVEGQLEAINWLIENTPEDAVIVTDNFAFVELRERRTNTEHYFRVDTDPEIRYNVLNDNQCNIDYLLTTPQVFNDIQTYGLNLMQRTFNTSEILMTYPNNGWPIEVRQVRKADCAPEIAQGGDSAPDSAS